MKIKNFKVENFKSLKNIDLELGNLTLLTGVNSSGKSSFIQALLLLRQNWNKLHLKIFNKTEPISINGNYVQLGNKQDLLYQDCFDEDIKLSISNVYHDLFMSFNTNNLEFDTNYIMATNKNRLYNIISSSFQYIQTNRIEPNVFYDLSDGDIAIDNIGHKGEFTAHYLAVNRLESLNIENLKHPNSQTNQLLENVSAWLSEISSGIEVSAKIYDELQKVNLTYKYTYGDNTTNNFTPLNVGFGLTFILPIIVTLLKSKPNDLIIIENPELHLHTAGQSKIAELCAIASQNGVQIIVETHSDHFLNAIRVATKENVISPKNSKVYYFRKNDNELETIVDTINIDNNGNIDKYPKGFFDEWDNSLDKLLGL